MLSGQRHSLLCFKVKLLSIIDRLTPLDYKSFSGCNGCTHVIAQYNHKLIIITEFLIEHFSYQQQSLNEPGRLTQSHLGTPPPKRFCTEADRQFNQIQKHSCCTRLTESHHGGLVGQLTQHATKWRDIGTHLGFLPGELLNIGADPTLLLQGAPVSWLSAMLAQWLERTSSSTLEDLKAALGKAGLAAAAHDLKL